MDNSGSCEAGYYCSAGSSSKTYRLCSPGSYCEAGSATPTNCPIGTYSVSLGATSLADCIDCPGGVYCDIAGLTTTPNNCSAGYYCPSGNSVANPVQYICPVGY